MLPQALRRAINDYTSVLKRVYPALMPPDGYAARQIADARAALIETIEAAYADCGKGEGEGPEGLGPRSP